MSPQRRREAFWGMLCVAPAILGFLLFSAGPILAGLGISFTDWNAIRSPNWIGFDNFTRAFGDSLFWQSVRVTLVYTVVSVPLRMVFAFCLALLLNQAVRGLAIFRTIFYLPTIVPLIASSLIWLWLFDPTYGIVNVITRGVGLAPYPGFGSSTTALPSLIIMSLWDVGGMMIIFLAGLQGVPDHLYEAVEIDGGNALQRLRYITIPLMTPTIFFNLVLSMIGTLQTFSQAYVMTQGGPANSTLLYVMYVYAKAFRDLEFGYASALSLIMFVLIAVLSFIVFRSSSRWVYYEGAER